MLEKWPWSNVAPSEERHDHEIYSIAVSLKRIADALESADLGKQLSQIEFNTREVL
jgi:hypothetical protein